jgi:hypothetical protein
MPDFPIIPWIGECFFTLVPGQQTLGAPSRIDGWLLSSYARVETFYVCLRSCHLDLF